MSAIKVLKELDAMKAHKEKDKEYIRDLKGSKNKVRYLRIKGYTQDEISEMIGISVRHVQRIEKELRDRGETIV